LAIRKQRKERKAMAWRRKFRDKSFNNLETKAKNKLYFFFVSCLPANWRSSMQKCWMGSGMEKLLTDFFCSCHSLSCETKEAWFWYFLADSMWRNLDQFAILKRIVFKLRDWMFVSGCLLDSVVGLECLYEIMNGCVCLRQKRIWILILWIFSISHLRADFLRY
jgi:hypothetical protein